MAAQDNTPTWFIDLLRIHSPSSSLALTTDFFQFCVAAGTNKALKSIASQEGPRGGLLASEAQRFNQQTGRTGKTQLKIVKLNGTNAGNGGARTRSWNPPKKEIPAYYQGGKGANA